MHQTKCAKKANKLVCKLITGMLLISSISVVAFAADTARDTGSSNALAKARCCPNMNIVTSYTESHAYIPWYEDDKSCTWEKWKVEICKNCYEEQSRKLLSSVVHHHLFRNGQETWEGKEEMEGTI